MGDVNIVHLEFGILNMSTKNYFLHETVFQKCVSISSLYKNVITIKSAKFYQFLKEKYFIDFYSMGDINTVRINANSNTTLLFCCIVEMVMETY